MHNHSSYSIFLRGTDAEIDAMSNVLASVFDDSSISGQSDITIDETYDIVYLNDIQSLAKKLVASAETAEFTIKGTIDTSESAGEFMDFEINYRSGLLTSRDSGWYVELDASDFDDYEEFCECYDDDEDEHRFTEEEFEQLQENVCFILDSGDGDIVTEVPLGSEEKIDIE